MNAPRKRPLLLGIGALVLVAAALYGLFGGGDAGSAGPAGTATTDTPAGDPSTRIGDATRGSESRSRESRLADQAADAGARERVLARTVLRGSFRAPSGMWPGGGRVALYPRAEAPEGGMMGLFSSGMELANASAEERAAFQARIERWLGRAAAVVAVDLDPLGGFAFHDPPAGSYDVRLEHAVLQRAGPIDVEVEEESTTDLGVLDTRLASSLLVLVADEQGAPVADASLQLARKVDMRQFMDPSVLEDLSGVIGQFVPKAARTDERGAHRFEGLDPAMTWNLSVAQQDFVEDHREVRLIAGRENLVRVELSKGAELTALVRGPDGEPYEGASLRLSFPEILRPGRMSFRMGAGGSGQEVVDFRMRTDADGRARVAGLPTGRGELKLRTPGFLRASQDVVVRRGQTATAELTLDPGVAISGRVVDEDDAPIPEARVTHLALLGQRFMGMDLSSFVGLDMLSLGMDDRGVACDADGRFVLGGFAEAEEANLLVAASGFDPGREDGVVAGTSDVEVRLLRACQLRGTVVADPEGGPVTDFAVRLQKRSFLVFDRPVVRRQFEGRTDGTFVLEPCPREALQLVVEAEGRATWTGSVDLREGSADAGTIRLLRPSVIEGLTTGPDGQPLMGVSVRVARGGPADSRIMAGFLGEDAVESDAAGRFRIDGLGDGRVRLIADKDGFAQLKTRAIKVASGETTDGVVLQLTEGGRIAGRIVDAAGDGLPDWRIQAALTSGRSLRMTQSDANGSFRLEGLATGTYKVDAINDRSFEQMDWMTGGDMEEGDFDLSKMIGDVMKWTVSDRVVVRDGEESELTMVFEQPEDAVREALVALEGSVRIGGEALPNGMVSLFQPGSTIQRYIGEVSNGAFTIDGVRPGTYRVQVQAGLLSGFVGRASVVRIPAAASHRVDLDLPGGRLEGVVRRADDEQPASGVVLSLTAPTAGGGAGATEAAEIGEGMVLTGADGRFRFDGLAAGSYDVFAKEVMLVGSAGRSGRLAGVALGAAEVRDDLVLYLEEGGTLRVVVHDASGPRANALVTLLAPGGGPLDLFHRSLTDPDGAVEFQVPEGHYRASVDAPGKAPRVSDPVFVESGTPRTIEVALDRGIPVGVQLAGEVPDDLRGDLLLYSVWRPDGALLRAGRIVVPRTEAAVEAAARARLSIGSYEPGTYRLRVEGSRVGIVEEERTVPKSGEATWTIDVEAVRARVR